MTNNPHKRKQSGRHRERYLQELKTRREQRERNAKDRSFWSSVGSTGTVGWSVAMPTAFGVLFGRWLDGRLDSAHVFMVFFMLIGLIFGCIMAWRLVSEKL